MWAVGSSPLNVLMSKSNDTKCLWLGKSLYLALLTLLDSTIAGQTSCLLYGKSDFVEAVCDIVCLFDALVGIVPF